MENILDMIILITLSGWLTTFLIKEKIEGESKERIKINDILLQQLLHMVLDMD